MCDESPSRLFKVGKSKDYSKRSLNWLIEHEYFGKESRYVCNVCIRYATVKLSDDPADDPTEIQQHDVEDVSLICHQMMDAEINDPEIGMQGDDQRVGDEGNSTG